MKTILFVCSGNTCRSPMAEAIARHLLASQAVRDLKDGGKSAGAAALIRSAGVQARDGDPATPEARRALKHLGIEMGAHASKSITKRMIADADLILVMTEPHRRALKAADPTVDGKVVTIDPAGDIPDPIGGPLEVYITTAHRLMGLIRRRFEDEGLIARGAGGAA
ncbi:MAG: low molecular weight protein arginine phosphatase [Phycisphaerales bacterium]